MGTTIWHHERAVAQWLSSVKVNRSWGPIAAYDLVSVSVLEPEMKAPEPDADLLARLELLVAKAKRKLSGAEFAILTLVVLGQRVSSGVLGLTRQGYKRALDALQKLRLVCFEGRQLRLHPEVCAEFSISHVNWDDNENNWLKKLTAGSIERPPAKNLYLLNADGTPASDEEIDMLRDQLFGAAALAASSLSELSEADVRRTYTHRTMSREAEMRALASFVMGFLESRHTEGLPYGLGHAVNNANRSVRAAYPTVLDPHSLLKRFKTALREIDDERIARRRREKKKNTEKAGDQSDAREDNPSPPGADASA